MLNDDKLEVSVTFILAVTTLTVTYYIVMAIIKIVSTIMSIINFIYQTIATIISNIVNFIRTCLSTIVDTINALLVEISNIFGWLGWSGTLTLVLLVAGVIHFIKKYVLSRQIQVKEDEAFIIESLPFLRKTSLFKGHYKMKLGERLCGIIVLAPSIITSNELCYILKNGESIRLEVSFVWHIIDPLLYYPNSKHVKTKLWSIAERMLRLELGKTAIEHLFNEPVTFNNTICEDINLYIEECDELGVRVENFVTRSLKHPRELVYLSSECKSNQTNEHYWTYQ